MGNSLLFIMAAALFFSQQSQGDAFPYSEIPQAARAVTDQSAIGPDYNTQPSATAQISGQGLQEHQSVKTEIMNFQGSCSGAEAAVQKMQQAFNSFDQDWQGCNSKQPIAANACLESLSPQIKTTASAMGIISSVMSATGISSNQKCNQMGDLMKTLMNGLSAYNTACAATKTMCISSCQSAYKKMEMVDKAIISASNEILRIASVYRNDPNNQVMVSNCESTNEKVGKVYDNFKAYAAKEAEPTQSTTEFKSLASKMKLCGSEYEKMMLASAAAIGTAVKTKMDAEQCAKETDGTGGFKAASAVDCAKAEYAQTPQCLCLKNPRLQGCGMNSSSSGGISSGGISGTAAGTGFGPKSSSGGLDGLGAGGASTDLGSLGGDKADGDSPGIPAGGGSGAGGGFGGGGSGAGGGLGGGGEGGGNGAKMPSVLAGETGGGGGFGGFRSGAGASGLSGYLPGGANDPRRGVAAHLAIKQITPQVGKSNWEKVADRYRDKKPSLLVGD